MADGKAGQPEDRSAGVDGAEAEVLQQCFCGELTDAAQRRRSRSTRN